MQFFEAPFNYQLLPSFPLDSVVYFNSTEIGRIALNDSIASLKITAISKYLLAYRYLLELYQHLQDVNTKRTRVEQYQMHFCISVQYTSYMIWYK